MLRKTTGKSKAPDIVRQDVGSFEILYRLSIDIDQPDDPVQGRLHSRMLRLEIISIVWRLFAVGRCAYARNSIGTSMYSVQSLLAMNEIYFW